MPSIDEMIANLKAQQQRTDHGLPPYRYPENVDRENARNGTIRAFRRAGLTTSEIVALLAKDQNA